MSEFWKKKIRKYFFTFDFDNDGVISMDDYVSMAPRVSSFVNEDKEKADQLKYHFVNVWKLYLKYAEVGDRDSLTPEELIVSLDKQRYSPELMKHLGGLVRGLHDALDVDRDGFLQEEEYERMMLRCGVPDQSFVKMAFKAIDVNGDEKLSLDEFIDGFFHFMFSEDEKSPYKYFFGPIDN